MTHELGVTPAQRAEALSALRARKVADGAHAFVRANAEFFYAEVDRLGPRALPKGPSIWICADCHSENIGVVAGENGAPAIELNDFDEAVMGDPAFDVLRLGLALASAGRTSGLGGIDARAMAESMLIGYGESLGRRPDALPPAPERFKQLLRKAAAQTHRALLDRRVPHERHQGPRRFLLGQRYWALAKAERSALLELVERKRVRKLVASITGDHGSPHVSLEDAAFRVAGTGSLGCFRAALLIRTGKHGADGGLRLLDVKEAIPTHAPASKETPGHDAERIVDGARALSPSVGARMVAADLEGTLHGAALIHSRGKGSVVVRDLMPQELKASLVGLTREEAPMVARYLGAVVGRAHRRQLGADEAREWRRDVCDPRWLLGALPPLIGAHEAAYLAHCVAFAR